MICSIVGQMSKLTICSSLQNGSKLIGFAGLHTSRSLKLKEFKETKEGEKIILEAVTVPSPRTQYLIKKKHTDCCYLCELDLNLKHTDVLILSQFVRSDGLLLPRRITGLCSVQQRKLTRLVSMAHIAGLMPNLVPKYSKPDCFKKRRGWKKYNTYFDESTIFIRNYLYEDHPDKMQYLLHKGVIKEIGPNKYVSCLGSEIVEKT